MVCTTFGYSKSQLKRVNFMLHDLQLHKMKKKARKHLLLNMILAVLEVQLSTPEDVRSCPSLSFTSLIIRGDQSSPIRCFLLVPVTSIYRSHLHVHIHV